MDSCLSVMKALADPTRLRILRLLEAGEMCVCQIVAVLPAGQSTVSQHLGILKRAGLVIDRKEGRWVFYRVHPRPDTHRRAILDTLSVWLEHDPLIREDQVRGQRVKALSLEEICTGQIDEVLNEGGNG